MSIAKRPVSGKEDFVTLEEGFMSSGEMSLIPSWWPVTGMEDLMTLDEPTMMHDKRSVTRVERFVPTTEGLLLR